MECLKPLKFYRILEHSSAIMCITQWNSLNLGNLLITGSNDKSLRIWDLDSEVCTNILHGHTETVVCVCVSSYGTMNPVIISGSVDKTLIQWSLEHGTQIRTLIGHKGVVSAVSISADLDIPVIVSSSVDHTIICWKLADGAQIGKISGHDGPISTIALSHIRFPVIISGGDDKYLRVWDLSNGSLIETLRGQNSEINSLAVSKNPLNPIIVSGAADGSVFVWDLLRLKLLYVLLDTSDAENPDAAPGSWEISSVAVSDNPQPIILSATWTRVVRIWDGRTGGLLRILDAVHTRRLSTVSIGRDEIGPVIISAGHDGKVVIWSPEEDLLNEYIRPEITNQLDSSSHYLKTQSKIHSMSLEDSIVLAGKYFCYWNLSSPYPSSPQSESNEQTLRIHPHLGAIIFYSLLRLGRINPQILRIKAISLNDLLQIALPVVDLLLYDPILFYSPVQFLIDNKLCLQRTYEWMKISSNIDRIIYTLTDSTQSSDTLDSILTAVVNDERLGGWDILLNNSQFGKIFRNLMLHSKRSHKKLALMLESHGMGVESEPYPSPLDVPRKKEKNVVRWNQVKQGVGIYCYRIRVHYALPMDFLLSSEFLAALSESDDIAQLVTVPLIQYIIQYKWESWGSIMTKRLGLFYVFYLTTTTISVLIICTGGYNDLIQHKGHIACIVSSVISNTLFMGLEFWQWIKAPSSAIYFNNLWHASDWAMILLCHLSIIVGTILGPIYIVRIMCTILTLLLWSRTLYFGRGEEDLSILIHTVKVIVWDVRYFILILFLFVSAFAISFRVLGVFDTLPMSFMRLFNMLYGDLGYDTSFKNREIPTLLYVMFLICVVIILLNSLIAFMENSFLFATNTRHVAALISRLQILNELDIQMIPFRTFYSFCYPNHYEINQGDLVVLSPESLKKPDLNAILTDSDKISKIDSISQGTIVQIEEIRGIMSAQTHDLTNRMEYMEKKMTNIEDKLDHILSWIENKERERDREREREREKESIIMRERSFGRGFSRSFSPSISFSGGEGAIVGDLRDREKGRESDPRESHTVTYSYYGEGDDTH